MMDVVPTIPEILIIIYSRLAEMILFLTVTLSVNAKQQLDLSRHFYNKNGTSDLLFNTIYFCKFGRGTAKGLGGISISAKERQCP